MCVRTALAANLATRCPAHLDPAWWEQRITLLAVPSSNISNIDVDEWILRAISEKLSPPRKTPAGRTSQTFDLIQHLWRQRQFSFDTFGPGQRTAGVVDHIEKELREIRARPGDLEEWVDVVLLALDGAWRAGHSPEEIADAIAAKQAKNEAREWPDWRTQPEGKAIEHIRPSA